MAHFEFDRDDIPMYLEYLNEIQGPQAQAENERSPYWVGDGNARYYVDPEWPAKLRDHYRRQAYNEQYGQQYEEGDYE